MLSDLLIVGITASLLTVCIYGLRTKYRVLAAIVLTIGLIPVLITLIINIPILISPLTPEVHGKVFDSKTRKPLANINIKAGWAIESYNVGGNSFHYYKMYSAKTNNNGEFIVPRYMKAISFNGLIFERKFYGVNLAAYSLEYDYEFHKEKLTDTKHKEITMQSIETDKSFAENIINFWENLRMMTTGYEYHLVDKDEKIYLKNAYYVFEKRYPNSNEDKQYLEEYFHIYSLLKEPETVYILNKMSQKFLPNTREYKFSQDNAIIYKNKYNIK